MHPIANVLVKVTLVCNDTVCVCDMCICYNGIVTMLMYTSWLLSQLSNTIIVIHTL